MNGVGRTGAIGCIALAMLIGCDEAGAIADVATGAIDAQMLDTRDASMLVDGGTAAADAARPSLDAGAFDPDAPLTRMLETRAKSDRPFYTRSGAWIVTVDDQIARIADGRSTPIVSTSETTSLACRGEDRDGAIVCLRTEGEARAVVRIVGDRIEPLAALGEGAFPGIGNDLVVRSDGTVFFTNRCDGHTTCARAPTDAIGSVIRFRDGVLTEVWRGPPNPNGIALSADERVLYLSASAYRDRGQAALWRASVDANGDVTQPERMMQVQEPDGIAVDASGRIYVSAANRVDVFDAAGAPLARLNAPDRVTNVAVANGTIVATTNARGVYGRPVAP